MQHNILIFIKISTWIGFNYPPKIRPKNTKLCIRLVLQEKIRHTHHMPHVSTNILTISLSPFMTASIRGDTFSTLRSLEICWERSKPSTLEKYKLRACFAPNRSPTTQDATKAIS